MASSAETTFHEIWQKQKLVTPSRRGDKSDWALTICRNEMALTIYNSISRVCFMRMRDWKLENLADGMEISAVPFRTEEEDCTSGCGI